MMDGPWYERSGPNAAVVRYDLHRKLVFQGHSNLAIGFE